MQIVSSGNNLHEMSKPVFWEKFKKNTINLSSTELAHRVIKVKKKKKEEKNIFHSLMNEV